MFFLRRVRACSALFLKRTKHLSFQTVKKRRRRRRKSKKTNIKNKDRMEVKKREESCAAMLVAVHGAVAVDVTNITYYDLQLT